MSDLVKFLDPIVEKIDSGNVGWNVTKDLVSVALDVSNMASGSKLSSSDIGAWAPRRSVSVNDFLAEMFFDYWNKTARMLSH